MPKPISNHPQGRMAAFKPTMKTPQWI